MTNLKVLKTLIAQDNKYEALALMTEKQLDTLIESKVLEDGDSCYYQDVQEEMRCMMAEAQGL